MLFNVASPTGKHENRAVNLTPAQADSLHITREDKPQVTSYSSLSQPFSFCAIHLSTMI